MVHVYTDSWIISVWKAKENFDAILQCDFRNNDSGDVRVYPGKLQVSESFCIVPVTEVTTVADLINEALEKFGLQNFNCDDYRCSEILLDRGGTFSHDAYDSLFEYSLRFCVLSVYYCTRYKENFICISDGKGFILGRKTLGYC